MVRGHICMLQRNRDIYYYYYDYYFKYNTQRKLIACKPNLCRMNFEISLGSIYLLDKRFNIILNDLFVIFTTQILFHSYLYSKPMYSTVFLAQKISCHSHSDVPLYLDSSLIILNLLCHQKDVFLQRNVCVVNYQPWNFLMTPL